MGTPQVYDQPSNVEADQGVVLAEGPDSIAVAMTPDAAEATADRLREAAKLARSQQGQGSA